MMQSMGNPKGKVHIEWSPDFAYAIGLIVTDGNLSPDGRHINFVSKDSEQIDNFQRALRISCLVRTKQGGFQASSRSFVVQFSDVLFYRFLLAIGLMPNKSRTIGAIKIPNEFFFDFIRGLFDGDGHCYAYWDPRWKSSFMIYTAFNSASKNFLDWLRQTCKKRLGIKGHMTRSKKCYVLRYAKKESCILINKMYYAPNLPYLSRKRLKIFRALSILAKQN